MAASVPCRVLASLSGEVCCLFGHLARTHESFARLRSDGERQRDFFLFFPGTVVRCFRQGTEEHLHLRDVEQPKAVEIPLGTLGHFGRELLRYVARLANPSELASHGNVQGFHQLDVELDVNVVVEIAPECKEVRENNKADLGRFDLLIKNDPRHFEIIPARTRADSYLLEEAHRNPMAIILTNDKYEDYFERYPDVLNDWKRRIQPMKIMLDGSIWFERINLSIPLKRGPWNYIGKHRDI